MLPAPDAPPTRSPDGKSIHYLRSGVLFRAAVGSTQPFTITSRTPVLGRGYVFGAIHADCDVAPDGRSIVALRSPDRESQLVIVRNLGVEIRARLERTPRQGGADTTATLR